jgi:hypothetical protein
MYVCMYVCTQRREPAQSPRCRCAGAGWLAVSRRTISITSHTLESAAFPLYHAAVYIPLLVLACVPTNSTATSSYQSTCPKVPACLNRARRQFPSLVASTFRPGEFALRRYVCSAYVLSRSLLSASFCSAPCCLAPICRTRVQRT